MIVITTKNCNHENKMDITTFSDAKSYYHCPDCNSMEKPPKKLDDLEIINIWIEEELKRIHSWKKNI